MVTETEFPNASTWPVKVETNEDPFWLYRTEDGLVGVSDSEWDFPLYYFDLSELEWLVQFVKEKIK